LRGQPPHRQETLPHPAVNLVVQRGETRFYGIRSGIFSIVLEGEGRVFGVKLRPGAFRLFSGAAVPLGDATFEVDETLGVDAATLENAILPLEEDTAMVRTAESFLRERCPPRDPAVDRVTEIADYIAGDRAVLRVEQVAERFGLHKRTLQRLFTDYVGVSPKWVIQRYRLQEAVDQLSDGTVESLSALALSLGYSDQAHFNR